jgi:hypothetical protein
MYVYDFDRYFFLLRKKITIKLKRSLCHENLRICTTYILHIARKHIIVLTAVIIFGGFILNHARFIETWKLTFHSMKVKN